jgi:hypothetical protein
MIYVRYNETLKVFSTAQKWGQSSDLSRVPRSKVEEELKNMVCDRCNYWITDGNAGNSGHCIKEMESQNFLLVDPAMTHARAWCVEFELRDA